MQPNLLLQNIAFRQFLAQQQQQQQQQQRQQEERLRMFQQQKLLQTLQGNNFLLHRIILLSEWASKLLTETYFPFKISTCHKMSLGLFQKSTSTK